MIISKVKKKNLDNRDFWADVPPKTLNRTDTSLSCSPAATPKSYGEFLGAPTPSLIELIRSSDDQSYLLIFLRPLKTLIDIHSTAMNPESCEAQNGKVVI